ncbi:GRASP55/65 PDZ-like domain-containing protein [Lipomyces oligophaga]|uniref:GRASP55/65 PDZ-like domain-containing protein n=1 Tax=Lipomyces oligophaga TaxID=45792 RepID=UPI0034CFF7DB
MGNEQSTPGGGRSSVDSVLLESFGFQVLKVSEGSLAFQAGFESFFDYICGINGHQLETDNSAVFIQEIKNCIGRTVRFNVFSAKGQRLREISVDLSAMAVTSSDGGTSLGLSLQWAPLALSSIVFHVLDVAAESPALRAGLIPDSDYIVGIEGYKLTSEGSLGEVLEQNVDRDLMLQVYNHDYDTVRLASIIPEQNWGGEGVLGCGIGIGRLHCIPPYDSNVPVLGEIFSAEYDDSEQAETNSAGVPLTQTELLLKKMHLTGPAAETAPSAESDSADSSALPTYMRKKHQKSVAEGHQSQLDEYFEEQEKMSKEIDYHPTESAGAVAPLPPPPKDSEIKKSEAVDVEKSEIEQGESSLQKEREGEKIDHQDEVD